MRFHAISQDPEIEPSRGEPKATPHDSAVGQKTLPAFRLLPRTSCARAPALGARVAWIPDAGGRVSTCIYTCNQREKGPLGDKRIHRVRTPYEK